MLDQLRRLFERRAANADQCSVAVAGDNNAPISIEQQYHQGFAIEQFDKLSTQLDDIQSQIRQQQANPSKLPSDATERPESDKQIDAQIDSIRDLIEQKPSTALQLFERMYPTVALSSSGRVRFRIKANIGICHYLLGDEQKAAGILLEAYAEAPNEPKAISNKVLALLLKGDTAEGVKFGVEQLAQNPDNEVLACYTVQCAASVPEVENPLELVPQELRNRPDMIVAHVHFLQKREKNEEWWAAACEGAKLYPDNDSLRYYAAEATLAEISKVPELKQRNAITANQKDRLKNVIPVIKARWQKIISSNEQSIRPDQMATGHNLLTAYLILRDIDAIRQFSTATIGDKRCNDELLEHVGRTAVVTGDIETAKTVLNRLTGSEAVAFLRFQIQAAEGDTRALALTPEEAIRAFPPEEQGWSIVLAKLADLESHGGERFEEGAMRALSILAGDCERAHVILSKAARKQGHDGLAEEEYDIACSLVTAESDFAGRAMVAHEALNRKDWEQVILVLHHHVSMAEASEELRMLAFAFANSSPPQEIGRRFFETLPQEVFEESEFALLAGTLYYNLGNLDKAEELFLLARAGNPNAVDCLLALAQTYLRESKSDSATELLGTVDLDEIKGRPIDKMHLAQLFVAHGRQRDGLELGFRILCAERNDSTIALAYVGLMLHTDPSVIDSGDVVRTGSWFRLENQYDESFSAVIDDGAPNYYQQVIAPDHPLATHALGRTVNEVFEAERSVGPALHWAIKEVLHKYVQAFQDIMTNFEYRFPEKSGLYKVNIVDNDLSALLDTVKNQSEQQRKGLDLYVNDRWPLAFAASALRQDVITIASRIRAVGDKIVSNTGQLSDLADEKRRLSLNNYDAVVLDTYTAWSIASGKLFPLLKRMFPRLVVPRSVVDDLQYVLAKLNPKLGGDGGSMSLSWRDGQFYREEVTAEQLEEQGRAIRERIEDIQKYCDVLPVVWPEAPPELVKRTIEMVKSPHIWDAACLANGESKLLLSEDLYYRQWAWAMFPSNQGSWLQAVFSRAVDVETISRWEYADVVLALASSRHDYLSLDSETLYVVFLKDETPSLRDFSIVADYIGGRNPDWPSHIDVSVRFLRHLWANSSCAKSRAALATGILVNNLLRYAESNWSVIFAFVWLCSQNSAALLRYLESWRIGHFLPQHEIQSAIRNILNR